MPELMAGTETQSKFRVRWVDLLRPDCYWPQPYSTEQALYAYQWLVSTGKQFCAWGKCGAYELLSKKPTCLGFENPEPIESLGDLRERFHFVLLSAWAGELAIKWRTHNRLTLDGERWICRLHSKPFGGDHSEHEWKNLYRSLLGVSGTIDVQLNRYHPDAKNVISVRLHVSPRGFSFVLIYGYDGSEWDYELARSDDKTTLNETLTKAWSELRRLGFSPSTAQAHGVGE